MDSRTATQVELRGACREQLAPIGYFAIVCVLFSFQPRHSGKGVVMTSLLGTTELHYMPMSVRNNKICVKNGWSFCGSHPLASGCYKKSSLVYHICTLVRLPHKRIPPLSLSSAVQSSKRRVFFPCNLCYYRYVRK